MKHSNKRRTRKNATATDTIHAGDVYKCNILVQGQTHESSLIGEKLTTPFISVIRLSLAACRHHHARVYISQCRAPQSVFKAAVKVQTTNPTMPDGSIPYE